MPKRKTADKNFADLQEEIDLERFRESVRSNFADFPDPRLSKRCAYLIWYWFLISLSGYLAGCNTVYSRRQCSLYANYLASF
ncbi:MULTISPECIES: hypothetical protein [unclassified Neochlamydia]|uniref:hypothetical protein n=1 Tax=unclassified Neochlamydia TaxID=2643326 RepID=UPI00140B1495|nr:MULTISPECIES: hypothetical protein [unclassified Neochlamydia]MBS4167273.1 hypothetical protein [Neochlamydia sp. AcF65]MBS4169687.1 hypothetical protein [Neochlamydia sp. AcF95]NGY95163.1 hypothetical protein [Neochlamydia sp. AcF84]